MENLSQLANHQSKSIPATLEMKNTMKQYTRRGSILEIAALAFVMGAIDSLQAQFDTGSDGSFGAINVAAGLTETLTIPPDGVFHCTTIQVANGATLKFNKNAADTPVYLLATGDITIEGTVSVAADGPNGVNGGAGGPGGYKGGNGSTTNQPMTAFGAGPGGAGGGFNTNASSASGNPDAVGHGVYAGTVPIRALNGQVYGNAVLIPLLGGSGGGGAFNLGGGGGGGAVLFGSNTRILFINGTVDANGGAAGDAGYGSGGAIRLVAPEVSGSGTLSANSLNPGNRNQKGGGRVRIDALVSSHTIGVPENESFSQGRNMVVFPPNLPKIEIIEAAGQTIDPSANLPVTVTVAPGSPATQPVKVRVTNFAGTAQLKVVLTPESGPKSEHDLDIDTTIGDPDEGTVNVDFPVNQLTRIDVWTR